MLKNFLGGILIEMLLHFPLIHLNNSSYLIVWFTGYGITTGLVGLYLALLYSLRKEKYTEIVKMLPTMIGIGTSFFFTVNYVSPVFR